MPGNPRECREHAKNCLRLAEETRLPEAKARYRVLAQRWLDIAADLELTVELRMEAHSMALSPTRGTGWSDSL